MLKWARALGRVVFVERLRLRHACGIAAGAGQLVVVQRLLDM